MTAISTTTFPPGGWEFYQPEINWKAPTPLSSTFDQTVQLIARKRRENPGKGLNPDPAVCARDLLYFTQLRQKFPNQIPELIMPPSAGRGGNGTGRTIIVRRTAALGDVLSATVVADKLVELGYQVAFQSHPAAHCILRRQKSVSGIMTPDSPCDVDLDGAYENDPSRRFRHFHQMFIERANLNLSRLGIHLGEARNCRPRLTIGLDERAAVLAILREFPRPWVLICPRSESHLVRSVPDGVWKAAAEKIHGTCFWLARTPGPGGPIHDLNLKHFDDVIRLCAVADLLVSVDTGPLHVAAAFNTPVVAINQSSSPELHLSDQCDFEMVSPNLTCLNCQERLCHIDASNPPCMWVPAAAIAEAVNRKLKIYLENGVSAVVAVWKPDLNTLNKCLTCLLPQVDEIIVTKALEGVLPDGVIQHEKIRYVTKNQASIGYGRNANYGTRHTSHKWLLLLNDDVFLDPGAVARMKDAFRPDAGLVANLLRYPDGTIQHGGKGRTKGARGWYHIDLRRPNTSIVEPTEMENVCLACAMIRREAFYDIGGFDEDFFLYAEDDDFCLRLGRAGWKIIFTPFSTGVHMEHQSTNKTANIGELCRQANMIFERKWGWWLTKNALTIPGKF